jgi:LacI family transcriptional regulator
VSRVTIKDVAKRANVSIATVSNVMNGSGRVSIETIKKVKHIIEELQFTPSTAARNLRDKNSRLIAVIVPYLDKEQLQDNPFYWQLVTGIEVGARDHKLHVILLGAEESENFSFVHERHLDGLIVVGAYSQSPILGQLLALNVPCVFMDSYLDDPSLYQIYIDDELGGYLGTQHLLEWGHRDIAVLCGKLEDHGVSHQRWLGYCRALEEAGITYNAKLVIEGPVSLLGGFQASHIIGAWHKEVTAVFAFSDVAAMGMMKGLQELGYNVPGDFSIVGFDNLFYSDYMVPSLTTVGQDIREKGSCAVDLLLAQINGETDMNARKVVLPVDLKLRQSTAPLN